MEFLKWYYLIFELPLLFAAMLSLLQATGLFQSDQDMDVDQDIDLDADVDVDMEVLPNDIEFDVDVDTDTETVGHDLDYEPGLFIRTLGFLGVGRIPISIVMITSGLLWGLTGWFLNGLIPGFDSAPDLMALLSMAGAGFVMFFGTGFLSKQIAKIMPTMQTLATKDSDLVGRIGEARYSITDKSGSVMLYDQYGNFQEVPCRSETDIEAGTQVVLVKFDRQTELFWVRRDTLAQEQKERLKH